MKAAVVTAADAAPQYREFAEPQVDDGYELVELVAAGLHPIVRSLAAGRHYGSTQSWPLVPGVDGVARTATGDLIYTGFVRPPHGTFAERMAVPKTMRIPLPPGADPVKVAGGLNPAIASWLALKARVGEIGSLGTVVVLGATGMAGYLALQHARLLGANRIVGVGRDPARLARAAALA
ncbi:MAG: zinc-binding alcohol dehydrogenase family protein, partial [Candidatus Cybelea sp.]